MTMRGLGLRSLSHNFAATLGRQLVATFLAFATSAIIARYYGPEGNGVYAMALLLPALLATFLSLGIAPANVYFLGSGQVTVREAVKVNLRIFMWLGLTGLVIGSGLLFWKSNELVFGVRPMLLWLILPVFPIILLSGFLTSIFQGLQEFATFNKILILQPILLLGSTGLIVLSGHKELELLIGAYLSVNLIVLVVVALNVRHLYISSSSDIPKIENYGKRAVGYGWKAHLSNILGFVNYKADIFLVNFFMSPASTGVYVIAVVLAEKLWLISTAVSTVLLPRLSQLSSDEATRKRLTPLISRLVLIVTLISSTALALAAYPLVWLVFGEKYMESVLPLLILLPGIVMIGGARVWANDIAARGRPEINMYVSLITLATNIIGNVILIPRFGLTGAAMATTIAYLICSLVTLVVYTRLTSNKWTETLFISRADLRVIKGVLPRQKSSFN
ncbi:MAG: O-antigen/teichoic acid export membrane protein [Saprospiraceae bacterium]